MKNVRRTGKSEQITTQRDHKKHKTIITIHNTESRSVFFFFRFFHLFSGREKMICSIEERYAEYVWCVNAHFHFIFSNDACYASEVCNIQTDGERERWSGGKDTVNAIFRALGLVNLLFVLWAKWKRKRLIFYRFGSSYAASKTLCCIFIWCFCNFCNFCWFVIILMVILFHTKRCTSHTTYSLKKFQFDGKMPKFAHSPKMCDLCCWPSSAV